MVLLCAACSMPTEPEENVIVSEGPAFVIVELNASKPLRERVFRIRLDSHELAHAPHGQSSQCFGLYRLQSHGQVASAPANGWGRAIQLRDCE